MTVIYFTLATLIVVVPWLAARRYGMLPWVSPLHFVAYFALFGVLLKTVTLAIAPELMMLNGFIDDRSSILLGYLYVLGFVVFISFGYIAGIKRRTHPGTGEYASAAVWKVGHPVKLALAGILIFLAAALSILAARGMSGFSSLFSVDTIYQMNSEKIVRSDELEGFGKSFAALKTFFIIPTFAFMVWTGRQIERPTLTGLGVTILLLGVVVFSVMFQAKRMELLNLLVYYLCAYVLLGHKVRLQMILKLFVALAGLVAIFVVMTVLRDTKGGLDNAEFVLTGALAQIGGSSYFLDINMPIVFVDRANHLEPLWGASYIYWLYGWIPREFWPAKPAVTLGPYVKQVVFGIYGSVGGFNPTGSGEAMLNFGWGGMLVGIPLGWIYRRFEEYLLKPRILRNKGGVWVYPLAFYPFLVGTLQSSFSATLIGSATFFVLLRVSNHLVSGPPTFSRYHRVSQSSPVASRNDHGGPVC